MKIHQYSQFKKDAKKQRKRGKDLKKLEEVIELLLHEKPLPERLRDHALTGNWSTWRDIHIEPDWLLIYKISNDTLILGRTGSHSDLF